MTKFLSHPFFWFFFFWFFFFFFLHHFHCLVHWPWSWLFLVPPFDAHPRLAALVSPPNYLIFFVSPPPPFGYTSPTNCVPPPNIRFPAKQPPAIQRLRAHVWEKEPTAENCLPYPCLIHSCLVYATPSIYVVVGFRFDFIYRSIKKKKLNGDCGPFESGEHSTAGESPKNSRPGANPTSDLGNCDRNLL